MPGDDGRWIVSRLRAVPDEPPREVQPDEYAAAAVIAQTLRDQAANMPLNSPYRGLALRSASRWSTIAGCRPISLASSPEVDR